MFVCICEVQFINAEEYTSAFFSEVNHCMTLTEKNAILVEIFTIFMKIIKRRKFKLSKQDFTEPERREAWIDLRWTIPQSFQQGVYWGWDDGIP